MLWGAPFPHNIQQRLITVDNPHGTLTSSDLELRAIIVGGTMANRDTCQKIAMVLLASDNTPAVA
jgi:hypothetical protein